MLTELTRLCVGCRLRVQAARGTCPRCRGTKLTDVGQGLELIRNGAPRSVRGGCVVVLASMAACGWSGWAMGVADHGPAVISAFTSALIGMVVGLALQSLLPAVARRLFPGWWARVDVERGDAGAASATTPEGSVIGSVVGSVVGPLDEALCSPLEQVQGVAVRLVGAVGSVAIDDASVVGFAVETDEGERVVVDPEHVVLALETGALIPVGPWSTQLGAFLAARGIRTADAEARLAEAVLRPGDRVRIEGTAVERADPRGAGGGMRAAPVARAFRGSLDRPVILRGT